MAKEGTILVVDDNRRILDALELLLGKHFARVITTGSPNMIDNIMQESEPVQRGLQHSLHKRVLPVGADNGNARGAEKCVVGKEMELVAGSAVNGVVDVVLLDMNFTAKINSGNEGLYWLEHIKKNYKGVEVVVFTAFAEIDLAVEAMRRGAFDFVVKPWDNERLVGSLQRAYRLSLEKRGISKRVVGSVEMGRELVGDDVIGVRGTGVGETGAKGTVVADRTQFGKSGMFWGRSSVMQQLKTMVEKVAVTDANVLITGENGTGKEILAREIHTLSRRRGEAMVAVDMGAITETLFESELFGHVKGAFTDARSDRTGKFEAANGGTLFLDEIGNLQQHLQVKLLTVLQRGAVVKVGSNTEQKIDVRMICATNCNLEQMVAGGSFREDLLYRINTIHLHIPPLRERIGDIVPLAQIFLKQYSQKYNRELEGFDIKAQEEMEAYPWPGNIRELQHTIEKAVILSDGTVLRSKDLMLKKYGLQTGSANSGNGFVGGNGASGIFGRADIFSTGKASTLDEVEANAIREAIARHNGNLSAVAEQLEITRQTLYNKIKKYGL